MKRAQRTDAWNLLYIYKTKERFEKKMFEKCDKCIALVLFTCLSLQIISFIQCQKIFILFAYASWQRKEKKMYIDNNQETSVSKSSVCGTWGSIIDSHAVKYSVSAGIKWTRLDVCSVAYILFWWSSFFSSQIFRYAVSFTCAILHSPHPCCVEEEADGLWRVVKDKQISW